MKIAIAQINPTVGDIAGNAELILDAVREAEEQGSDLTVFPELALTGYPPEDLIFKPAFIKDNLTALYDMAPLIKKSAALIGFIDKQKGRLFNAAAFIEQGKIKHVYHKRCLPNYGVFDEERYFEPGTRNLTLPCGGMKISVTICEDIWGGPAKLKTLKAARPDLLINLSASPYHAGKMESRRRIVKGCAKTLNTPVLYCNLVGGQDELVFDGGSFLMLPNGRMPLQCPRFQTGLTLFDADVKKRKLLIQPQRTSPLLADETEEIYAALVLGIKDYVNKNGFQKAALGISGGIDSGLTAALAVAALGPDRVVGVAMPSRFNISETRQDAARLAKNLDIQLLDLPIQAIFESFQTALSSAFGKAQPNIAEENLQARIRGTLLMALSNKFNWLVLTTGNKSETSTGYCTLYGDMAGGFAVLKDVLKTTVYKLARFINKSEGRQVVPASILNRPPTAELKENQKDEDALGAYDKLDPVIRGYVEENWPMQKLISKAGVKPGYAQKIVSLIDKAEYKRRQSPPGVKITPRAFGRDHRMPITNRYKQEN